MSAKFVQHDQSSVITFVGSVLVIKILAFLPATYTHVSVELNTLTIGSGKNIQVPAKGGEECGALADIIIFRNLTGFLSVNYFIRRF